MKKKVFILLMLCLLWSMSVSAYNLDEIYNAEAQNTNVDEINRASPNEARDFVNEISQYTPDVVAEVFSLENLWNKLSNDVKDTSRSALPQFSQIIIALLTISIFSAFKESIGGEIKQVLELIAMCVLSVIIFTSINSVLSLVFDALRDLSAFNVSSMGVLSTALASSGAVASASALQGAMVLVNSIVSVLNSSAAMGAIQAFLILSIVGGLNSSLTTRLTTPIHNFVCWILGIGSTVVAGFIATQSFLTSSMDAMSVKVMTFTVNGIIPVVGGNLAELLRVVMGYSNIMKNTIGAATLGIVIVTALKPFLLIVVNILLYKICIFIASFSKFDSVVQLLTGVNSTLSLIFAVFSVNIVLFMLNSVVAISMGGVH